ncbi:hypothetical protein KXR53_23180 [Inquilinus limosus]|uniref:hypothetical protein n=1 Tax=Inquilinus limosus TaxID=171674 RepID=UPI003F163FF6
MTTISIDAGWKGLGTNGQTRVFRRDAVLGVRADERIWDSAFPKHIGHRVDVRVGADFDIEQGGTDLF